MEDLSKFRKDFPMLDGKKRMNGKPLIYLDNAATTFKPYPVIDTVMNFYQNETTNVERGDYELSVKVSQQFEDVRKDLGQLLNCDPDEIVYTSGATGSLNLVAYGYGEKFLKPGDIILTTQEEHASDILPWFKVAKEKGAKVEYIPLDDQGRILPENLKKVMNDAVKLVAFTAVSNVLGYITPVKELSKIVHEYGAVVSVDGAQAVPHLKIDVKDWDCDFLSFSGHKMCGPSGIGVLYGKTELLKQMDPYLLGGGSNARFDALGDLILREVPFKFEAGTPPIEQVLGLGSAAKYLMSIGMENIQEYEYTLRNYLVEKLQQLDNIILYNPTAQTGIVTFNVKDVFPQDVASYLSHKGIAVRSGLHCAKILPDILKVPGTVRASLYFYNTFAECDQLVEALKGCNLQTSVDIFF